MTEPDVEDLTVFSQPSSSSSPFKLCMVTEVCSVCTACVQYDMTCTDSDQCWTLSPELNTCCCVDGLDSDPFQHVRVVIDELPDETFMSCDVILDSGADTSVLPLRYSSIGEVGPAPSTVFVDAQGRPLAVDSTRVATLQFGDVAFKEKFIVSDVATPLVALGHIIRAGWNLVQGDSSPCLVKGSKSIQVHYRNNSLCARGSISMVSQVAPQDALPSVRMVQLGIVLRTLAAGWDRLSPHLLAIRTTLPKYVGTTVTPASEPMWFRTTFACREGSGWEISEFCEAIGGLPGGIDEEMLFPETVLEVITLAHKHAMPAENLGFFMPDYGLDFSAESSRKPGSAAVADKGDDKSSGYEPSIADDPPEEAPLAGQDGEPLEEDRAVEKRPDEAVVHVDGAVLTIDSPLRALRAGCLSLVFQKGEANKCASNECLTTSKHRR